VRPKTQTTMAKITSLILVALFGAITTFAKPYPTHRVGNRDAFINSTFTPSAFMQALLDNGVQHPEIAYSQALVESGYFTSKMFRLNHNMFGMKLALYRKTTAVGERFKHARFRNWLDAVKDYKLWQEARLKGKTVNQKQYFANLSKYAADKHYLAKVRKHLPESYDLLGIRPFSDPREIHLADVGASKADVEYLGTQSLSRL